MLLLKCLLISHRGVCVTHTQPKHRSPIALAQHTNCSTTTKNDTMPFVLHMVALARAASLACASRTGAGDHGHADAPCPLSAQAAEAALKTGGTKPYLLLGATPWRHSQARRRAAAAATASTDSSKSRLTAAPRCLTKCAGEGGRARRADPTGQGGAHGPPAAVRPHFG